MNCQRGFSATSDGRAGDPKIFKFSPMGNADTYIDDATTPRVRPAPTTILSFHARMCLLAVWTINDVPLNFGSKTPKTENLSWYTAQERDNHHGVMCQNQLSWKCMMAPPAIFNLKNINISRLDKDISTNTCVTAVRMDMITWTDIKTAS